MDKQTRGALMILLVVGFVWAASGGLQQLQAPAQAVTPGAVTTDGVTVYTGTPTVEWYATDEILGSAISPGHFRVTLAGTESEQTASDTVNASIGDSYTICLMPNSTYYGKCTSGTVQKTVEKVNLSAYKIGTATIWINNDPENATTRNSESAVDTLAASDTDTPTLCFQGATANASYGNGSVLVGIDYNTNQLSTAPSFSKGVVANDKRPAGYTIDGNALDTVFYEVAVNLTNQETVCGTLTVTNSATNPPQQKHPKVSLYDRALFRHSDSDVLVEAYARPTTGADTNSATNATAVYYLLQ